LDLADVAPVAASDGIPIIVGPAGPEGPPGPEGPVGPQGGGVVVQGVITGAATALPVDPAEGDLWLLGDPNPTAAPDPDSGTAAAGDGIVWTAADGWVNLGPIQGPAGADGAPGAVGEPGPPGADGTDGVDGADGADGAIGPAGPPGADGTDGVDGIGITDGDKGDVVVTASGATWMLDSSVVTAAAKTVLDDTTTAAMLTTLGAAPATRTIGTTAPLTGGGDLSADRTLAISDFTASTRGAVPNPSSSSGRFLKDDGTWDSPASVISGVGGVFPFMLSGTATEPPTGSQIRGNNATFTSSTKLWIAETTVDGLDVSVGLGRIKAGFQVYVQDYDNSAVFAVFNVTADSTDSGTYREVTVALATSAGTIPAGKVAVQTLSSAQAGNLFSTTTSAKGLAPGSSGGGASVWLNGNAGWTAPVKADVGLGNVDNTSNATERAATATLTNKRITKRTSTETSSATPTINTDNVDFHSVTALAANITSMTTNLSGTPTQGQTLWIAITGTGARTIAWGASFEASTVALPTTTVTTNRLDVGFVWNTVTSKWRCVAAA
jgi:hypothetical protein